MSGQEHGQLPLHVRRHFLSPIVNLEQIFLPYGEGGTAGQFRGYDKELESMIYSTLQVRYLTVYYEVSASELQCCKARFFSVERFRFIEDCGASTRRSANCRATLHTNAILSFGTTFPYHRSWAPQGR